MEPKITLELTQNEVNVLVGLIDEALKASGVAKIREAAFFIGKIEQAAQAAAQMAQVVQDAPRAGPHPEVKKD